MNNEVDEQPPPKSRRRTQLLAKPKQPLRESSSLLTKKDVIALKNDRSPAVRGAIAQKFGVQYDRLAQSKHGDLATAVLLMLVKDVSIDVRSKLSREIAGSKNLPAAVISRMAQDDIEVALPVLRQSPLFEDGELIEIVRTQSMQYALAVAGRYHVSEELSATLIETGNRDVVLTVAGNAGAQINQNAMQRVLDEHRNDIEIQDRMARRSALPFEIIEQLVGIIGDKLEWELVNTRRLPPEQAAAIMQAVRSSSSIDLTAQSSEQERRIVSLRERMQAGEFEREDVVKALRDGDVQLFELGLALFARIDHPTLRKLLYNDDRRRLAAVCAAGDFNPPHYLTMRMALELAHEVTDGKTSSTYGDDSVRYVLNQYERLKLDHEKIEELLTV